MDRVLKAPLLLLLLLFLVADASSDAIISSSSCCGCLCDVLLASGRRCMQAMLWGSQPHTHKKDLTKRNSYLFGFSTDSGDALRADGMKMTPWRQQLFLGQIYLFADTLPQTIVMAKTKTRQF